MADHVVVHQADLAYAVPALYDGRSSGFTRAGAVGETAGAVHTGFGICRLDAAGGIDPHVHSFEESFYVLDGTPVVDTPEGSSALRPGDYGVIPVGMAHSWRNLAEGAATWAEMQAPTPRSRFTGDTFFTAPVPQGDPVSIDVRDPRTRSFGHIDPENMDPSRQSQEMLAVSASMRTALLVYSGITVKMMVDSDLGSQLATMFMVQYEPGGVAGAHDHPLEETYLILDGEVDATFDGARYHLRPGDIAWAGVGCVHEFSNDTGALVRWLETQAPMPPARHSYRFARDWGYLTEALDGDART